MLYTQLRSFHAVAKTGGFTAAARTLRVGQPTITTQVRQLEQYYGAELFQRSGRRVRLTELGRGLFEITSRLLGAEAEAEDYLRAAGEFRIGHLRVGAVGPYHVAEMLAAFAERYPHLRVTVSIGNSEQMLQALLDFAADVAVLAQTDEDPRFLWIPYSRHPVIIMVPASHHWAGREAIRLSELEGQRMVYREVGSTTRRALEAALKAAGVQPDIVMDIGSREAVWGAVIKGIGIGFVSEAEYVPHPGLRPLRIADAAIYTYAHVACLAERQESRLIRAFLNTVRDIVPKQVLEKQP